VRQLIHRGFALGELLLATLIFAMISTLIVTALVQQQADVAATKVAEQSQAFAQAAQSYYLANSTAMLAAMADGTGAADHCVINTNPATGVGGTTSNDATLRTCAMDVTWLQWKKALPMGFNPKSGRASRWVAIYRSIYDGTTQTGDVEMLVVMARDGATFDVPMKSADLSTAATNAGEGGGYVPASDIGICTARRATTTYQACGAGQGWKVTLNDFITAASLTTFADQLPN
jgi:type II secretory pathway pseudopilin PulG